MTGDWTGRGALAGCCSWASLGARVHGAGDGIRARRQLRPAPPVRRGRDPVRLEHRVLDEEGQASSGFILHLRPGLTLESPADPAAIDSKANLDWAQYLGENSSLSRLYGEAQLGVGHQPARRLGLEVPDSFRRSTSTEALNFGGAVVANSNQLRWPCPGVRAAAPSSPPVSAAGTWRPSSPSTSGQLCTAEHPGRATRATLQAGLQRRPAGSTSMEDSSPGRPPCCRASTGSGSRPLGARRQASGLARVGRRGGPVHRTPGRHAQGRLRGPLQRARLHLQLARQRGGGVAPAGDHQPEARLRPRHRRRPGAAMPGYTSHRGYLKGRALLAGRYSHSSTAPTSTATTPHSAASADLFQLEPSVDVELARWLRVGGGAPTPSAPPSFPPGRRPCPA